MFRDKRPRPATGVGTDSQHASEPRFRALSDPAVGMTEVDNEGRVTAVNDRFCQLTGYSREELLGMDAPHGPLSHLEDVDEGRANLQRLMRGEIESYQLEKRIRRKDGQSLWVKGTIFMIRDAGGASERALLLVEDLLERERGEETLRRELEDNRRLKRLSTRLIPAENPEALYEELVDAAVDLMRSDRGSMQLLDEATGELILLATRGLSQQICEAYARIASEAAGSSCAEAARRRERVVVENYATDERLADTADARAHVEAGIRAAQSTPLVSRSGRLLGMVTTHWDRPHRPEARQLTLLDILARQAADLIERKQAERVIRESEQREKARAEELEALMRAVPAVIFLAHDAECQRMTGSRLTYEMLRMPRGANFSKSAPAGEAPEHFEVYRDGRKLAPEEMPVQRAAQGEDVRGDEIEIHLKDSPGVHLLTNAILLHDEQGEIRGAIAAAVDITDRKRLEVSLRESQAWLNHLFDSMAVGVYATDSEGRIQRYNETMAELWGRRPQPNKQTEWYCGSVRLKRLDGTPLPLDQCPMAQAVRHGKPTQDELIIERPDGSGVFAAVHPSLVRDEAGRMIGAVNCVIDITGRKRAEHAAERENAEACRRSEQLQRLAVQLTQAEQQERQKLAEVLHDHIQQILVAAKMQAGLLKGPRGECTAEKAQSLIELLDEAIDSSRSLSHELSPQVLYEAGLGAALRWLAPRVTDKYKLRVYVDADPETEPASEPVKVVLFQAVRELLLNVVKHAGVDEARVRMSDAGEEQMRLVVEDHGKGFDLDRCVAGRDGRRLGLFGLRERLEAVGGALRIDSAPGRGTRITLLAPMKSGGSETVREISSGEDGAPAAEAERARTVRVLLADDHRIVREGLAQLLSHEPSLELIGEAADGQQAVDMVAELKPDVVVMDVSMPRMDGIEATRRIKRDSSGIAVIGLSMGDPEGTGAMMRASGASEFLNKQEASAELVNAIRQHAGEQAVA